MPRIAYRIFALKSVLVLPLSKWLNNLCVFQFSHSENFRKKYSHFLMDPAHLGGIGDDSAPLVPAWMGHVYAGQDTLHVLENVNRFNICVNAAIDPAIQGALLGQREYSGNHRHWHVSGDFLGDLYNIPKLERLVRKSYPVTASFAAHLRKCMQEPTRDCFPEPRSVAARHVYDTLASHDWEPIPSLEGGGNMFTEDLFGPWYAAWCASGRVWATDNYGRRHADAPLSNGHNRPPDAVACGAIAVCVAHVMLSSTGAERQALNIKFPVYPIASAFAAFAYFYAAVGHNHLFNVKHFVADEQCYIVPLIYERVYCFLHHE